MQANREPPTRLGYSTSSFRHLALAEALAQSADLGFPEVDLAHCPQRRTSLRIVLCAGVDVPGDVSISGYDNSLLAQLTHIDLTSVSQEPREQDNRAVAAVVVRLDGGRTDAVSSVLQSRLIVRDSTAPAPNHKDSSAT